MSTQAVLSLVNSDGDVVIKTVVGCNGFNIDDMVNHIISNSSTLSIESVYDLAIQVGFGCKDCLVVMDSTSQLSIHDDDELPRYRETFNDPIFNPRWGKGTASYVQVIIIDSRRVVVK